MLRWRRIVRGQLGYITTEQLITYLDMRIGDIAMAAYYARKDEYITTAQLIAYLDMRIGNVVLAAYCARGDGYTTISYQEKN